DERRATKDREPRTENRGRRVTQHATRIRLPSSFVPRPARNSAMQQLDLVIHNSTGLHARPARVFVDIAKQYQSTIQVRHGEKRVNAKSLIAVLTLGVTRGQSIQIDVSGADEELAAAALAAAVRDGLGEDAVDAEAPTPMPLPVAAMAPPTSAVGPLPD